MPLSGLLKTFQLRTLFLLTLLCAFVFSIYGAINPQQALAEYRWAGSQCRFYYGDMEGHELSLPVDDHFCEGGGNPGSCHPMNFDDCDDLGVPGKGGINGCYEGGEIKVRYDFDGNPGTVEENGTGAPTGIFFDAKCDSTWSDGGGHDYHLNIDYLNEDDGWRSIRHGSVGSQEDFKIENGDSNKYVPMSLLRDDMADYTKAKAFVFYPNCAGRNDSIDEGCFRTQSLGAHIVDPGAPTCSVTSTKVGNDFRINITGQDAATGILRLGLTYTPVDINGNATGAEVVQVNNDFMYPEGQNNINQEFTISGGGIASGQRYNVKAKVWDVRGSNNYLDGKDYSANYAECTTLLQCIMPLEQVNLNMTCTPLNSSYTDRQVEVLNLNQNGFCQIDYVNVSEVGTTSPDAGIFDYPNYWNKSVTGSSTTFIPQGFLRRQTNVPLELDGGKRYWISYWDQQSGQLTAGRSFVTPPDCRAPSGVPTITYTPECKIDPGNINDPANPKRELRWTLIPASQRGDGFLRYIVEVWQGGNLRYTAHLAPDATSVALGAWYVTQLSAGNTYSYRLRGESLGGYGPWTAFQSRFLIRKPSSAVNFRRTAFSSGIGAAGTPYQDFDWTYSDGTAPVATLDGWRMEAINTSTGNVEYRLPGAQTDFRHNLTFAQCNDTSYTYRLTGVNTCGAGPSVSATYTCPANRAPTCEAIQYSTNNGATWTNYPTGSGGLTRNPSTGILLKRHCTDPEGNSIRYEWSTPVGCGTFNPAVQTMASPHSNGGLTAYTFAPNNNMGCNLTSIVRDNVGSVVPNATVVAKTFPFPNAGSHTISLGSRSIQRLNTADAYAVFSGVTQDLATVRYNIVGYDNLTAQGSTTNRPGTSTINTTSANVNGKINICHPTYGTCTFANPTNSPNITNNRITNITAVNSNYDINVRLASTHQPGIRDIMVDSTSTNVKYAIHIDFAAIGANGSAISAVADGSPRIINNAPTCSGVTFGPTPGSPYRQGNITVGVTGRDDWGLKGLTITYQRLSGGNVLPVVNNDNQFDARLGTASFDVSTANMTSGYYRFNISMRDGDGSSVNCTAAGNITGDETPGGGILVPGDPPIILIDKQAPQCGTGGMTVIPNAAGELVGFTVAGTDPTAGASFGGLSRVHILAKRPNDTVFGTTPVLSFNIPNTPKPQTYTHTFSNASAATSYNLAGLPSGIYSFRAVWTDRAGNVSATPTSAATPCDGTYEKTSRISGKVNMFTGIDGDQKRDYAREATGTQFSIVTKPAFDQPGVAANWQNATPTSCTATYPGVAGLSSCAAYFVSGVTYSTQTPPVVELSFPRLASDGVLGKYRCSMSVWNTTTTPWSLKRPVVPDTQPSGGGATCSGTTCVCRFVLSSFDMTVDTDTPYTATSIWPTHVEFDISYNSDQVYGRVENEMGNTLSGNTVSVSRGAWTSPAAPVSVTGAYRAPAPVPDDPVNYARTNQPTTVRLNNADPTRLCVWAARNNFVNPGANASRTAASTTFANASVRDVAQDLELTGFTVGASSQCTTQGLSVVSGPISPKNQNQVNFLVLPKVQITGQIYYLKNDNLCGNPAAWADPDNWSTDAPIDVNLSFDTINPSGSVGALDEFYNPANPTEPEGAASYTTGQAYTVYANSLPGSNWNSWQIQADIDLPANDRITHCGSGIVDVGASLPNYPTGTNASVITAPIAVFMNETNDWWQTYNGGVHGLNSISNSVPTVDAVRENLCGHDAHTIVGRGTCGMYSAGTPALRNPPFRGYATSGLVTTRGPLHEFAGRTGLDWRITASTVWGDPDMHSIRLPFTSSDGGDLTVIEKVAALGTTENWKVNPTNLVTAIGTAGNGRAFFGDDLTIDNPITLGNNNYIVVDGDLTINDNLVPTGTGADMRQSIFIVAAGNVTIGPEVTELNAYIYTPGNITVQSGPNGADDPAEVQLKVYGGLYAGGNVDFRRDIPNIDANWGYPSTQIMFNPALIVNSRRPDFPTQLKETNIYWTQD